jgi:hypothetical protein
MIVSRDPCEPICVAQAEELRRRYPDAARLAVAFALANDIDAAADLLSGRAVDHTRLDPDALLRARQHRLVQLIAPIDLLEGIE